MNNDTQHYSSIDIASVRRASIGRRGGVKVRGGRLPPIRMRDVVTTNKKVVAPKIPQRRVKVKQELPDSTDSRPLYEKDIRKDNRSSSSRGRGSRAYIQTEGSFLGEGPAIRAKKESVESHYERIPRSAASKIKLETGVKLEDWRIKDLLENYDEQNAYLDFENEFKPVRIPSIKVAQKLVIKQEILDDDEIKPLIKSEPIEGDTNKVICPEENSFDKITNQEKSDTKVNVMLEAMKLLQEEETFMLLQLPACLPFGRLYETSNPPAKKDVEKDEKDGNSQEEISANFKDIPEGRLGKMQVTKSGRIRIVFGSVQMEAQFGKDLKSFSEVVFIPLKDKVEGDVIVLGNICRRIVLYPIFNDTEKGNGTEETIVNY